MGIAFLGFSSGLPFLLTLATLHVWLTELGVTKTTIGFFAIVTIPYSLKFIWAPFIDTIKIPLLTDVLGQKKSWMFFSQIMLVISLIFLGNTNPETDVELTAFAALIVSFFSATQDICIEAYRVQKLPFHEVGIGASASHLGYRIGMWVSGAGALYLASEFSWSVVYAMMAACMCIGMITVLLSQEPVRQDQDSKLNRNHLSNPFETQRSFAKDEKSVFIKLRNGIRRAVAHLWRSQDLVTLIMFVIFFKMADTFLNSMTVPFLLEIGFDKLDIANVGKSFGISAMIVGGLMAGIMLAQKPLQKAVLICSFLQVIAAVCFYLQSLVGDNIYVLFFTIGVDNFANGMSFATFIAYLSYVSRGPYAGTTFALLTSFASFARVIFSYFTGACADRLSWSAYYTLTICICLSCLGVVIMKKRKFIVQNVSV